MKGIKDHMSLVARCCRQLAKAYEVYLEGKTDDFEKEAVLMRQMETQADDARRQVELAIYSGAFMPIHREDYLNLAELIDKVADDSVSVANLLSLTQIEVPGAAKETISDMIEKTIACVDTLEQCVSVCIEDRRKAADVARHVEELEEAIDEEEFALRTSLYRMKIDGYDKILLNELVEKIGNISDTAEDVSDRIVIMISKRG
jgi:predicted phosphate transport protein (TIGR00153 family)